MLVIFIFLVSCSAKRYIYSPSVPNDPYFTESGQAKIAGYYSGGGNSHTDNATEHQENNGMDLQGAYSITDHVALTVSYFNRKERDVYPQPDYNYFTSSEVKYKRNLTEFGVGYFAALDKTQTVWVNIYAGVGTGNFSFDDWGQDQSGAAYTRAYDSRVVKYFIQPAFNCFAGKYVRLGLIGKLSFVRYKHISTSYNDTELQYFNLDLMPHNTFRFFEPAITMQAGFPKCDWLKVEGELGFASNPAINSNLRSRNFNASFGVSFNFSTRKK